MVWNFDIWRNFTEFFLRNLRNVVKYAHAKKLVTRTTRYEYRNDNVRVRYKYEDMLSKQLSSESILRNVGSVKKPFEKQ